MEVQERREKVKANRMTVSLNLNWNKEAGRPQRLGPRARDSNAKRSQYCDALSRRGEVSCTRL
jgi:hypothetical protein